MNTLAEPGLRIEPSRQGGATVLSVDGDVDAANAHFLREAVIEAIDSGSPVVVIDLAQVGYVDSVGLGTLVVSLKRAAEQRTALRLVVTSPQIEKVLKITGLLSVFDIYSDQQSAVHGPSS
jgi:anti-sigma B factor antagonist